MKNNSDVKTTVKKSRQIKNPAKVRRTRSIARSIKSGFALRLLGIFLVINIVVMFTDIWDLISVNTPFSITGRDLYNLCFRYQLLLIPEAIFWLLTLFFGSGWIRKKLRPLDQMADAASFITGSGGFDETRFNDLQNAIDSLNPNREGARIRTGDKDLAGLELAVNKLVERMHESYRQQARFVSDASHELRTPIAVIQGYANMLTRWGKEDEKILGESIEAISAEAERMKRLVEQLLFLARGDAGRIALNIQRVDLSALMHEVYEESSMIDTEHVYTLSAPEPIYAMADADMLKQLARILVENAVKYTPVGRDIILKAGEISSSPSITVQDYGVGIPGEDVPHVFERFYRADGARTRSTGGTGLGLAIAKWIADRHGGWFEITSREELGTRVSLCLSKPLAEMV